MIPVDDVGPQFFGHEGWDEMRMSMSPPIKNALELSECDDE